MALGDLPRVFEKDPAALLDYSLDWSPWLASTGDTITTSAWTVDAGLTKSTESHTDMTATVWLSGGVVGTKYRARNTITTAGGRQDERSLIIYVTEL